MKALKVLALLLILVVQSVLAVFLWIWTSTRITAPIED